MAAEQNYLDALPQVTSESREHGTLLLSGPEVALTFEPSEPVGPGAHVPEIRSLHGRT